MNTDRQYAAAQCLTGAPASGAPFGVIDDEHSEARMWLQFAQLGEQGRDLPEI